MRRCHLCTLLLALASAQAEPPPHLLIGQGTNDPRVTIQNVNMMVEALRKAKREVTYVVYPDEGHGFARPENNRDFYGRVEEFFEKHLGGRAEPWKKIEGATAEGR